MTSSLLVPRPQFCHAQSLGGQPALPLRAAWLWGDCGLQGLRFSPQEMRDAASRVFKVVLGHSCPQEPS